MHCIRNSITTMIQRLNRLNIDQRRTPNLSDVVEDIVGIHSLMESRQPDPPEGTPTGSTSTLKKTPISTAMPPLSRNGNDEKHKKTNKHRERKQGPHHPIAEGLRRVTGDVFARSHGEQIFVMRPKLFQISHKYTWATAQEPNDNFLFESPNDNSWSR